MKVLLAGADGMVGQAVTRRCRSAGDEVYSYNHEALEISDLARVQKLLEKDLPEVVINCAAWTDVDGCERNPARAYAANATGPENLAQGCKAIGAGFITISTDYVFDGHKSGFYTQRDNPNPQSIYGKSKLEGERAAQRAHARTVLVRTGFIFGPGGRNFLSKIVEQAGRGETLQAINDAFGTPTYAVDLAARLRELALLDLPGIYHVVNGGDGASYEDFVRAALELAKIENAVVKSISASSLKRPAPRPQNSRLRCLLSPALGLAPLRSWREGLREFVAASPTGFSLSRPSSPS